MAIGVVARVTACILMVALASCRHSTIDASPAADVVYVSATAARPPNVILFLVDDLGWRDVGFMGSTFYRTPHTDALAASGVRFNAAYSASPVCSPTRAALMTGKDPVRLRITDWIPGWPGSADVRRLETPAIANALAAEEVTLAERFKAAGYQTMFAGKWHLGAQPQHLPQAQGYDLNFGGYEAGAPRGRVKGREYFSPYGNPQLTDGPDGEFLTDRLGRETVAFIRSNADRPFFVTHAFYQVHTPLHEAAKHIARAQADVMELEGDAPAPREMRYGIDAWPRQDNARYSSMVAAFDDVVGEVMSTLNELGLDDDTIVIFTSDNGGLSAMMSANPQPTSNEPLRGSKGWLYEGGIRVPLVIRTPGRSQQGAVSNAPVTTVDVAATILDLAGLTVPSDVDGVSLRSQVEGRKTPPHDLFWHYPHYHASGWRPGGAVRSGRYKLIEYFEDMSVELFDLAADPREEHDLSATRPEKVLELRDKLNDWRTRTGAEIPISIRASNTKSGSN